MRRNVMQDCKAPPTCIRLPNTCVQRLKQQQRAGGGSVLRLQPKASVRQRNAKAAVFAESDGQSGHRSAWHLAMRHTDNLSLVCQHQFSNRLTHVYTPCVKQLGHPSNSGGVKKWSITRLLPAIFANLLSSARWALIKGLYRHLGLCCKSRFLYIRVSIFLTTLTRLSALAAASP